MDLDPNGITPAPDAGEAEPDSSLTVGIVAFTVFGGLFVNAMSDTLPARWRWPVLILSGAVVLGLLLKERVRAHARLRAARRRALAQKSIKVQLETGYSSGRLITETELRRSARMVGMRRHAVYLAAGCSGALLGLVVEAASKVG